MQDNWQYIRDDTGKKSHVVIASEKFQGLERAAQKSHDFTQLASFLREEQDGLDLIPADVVQFISNGDHPVRAWRKHKELKAVELARQAGISPAYLSEIETGKKDGTFKTMAAISICLGVRLDDLAPAVDPSQRAQRMRRARRTTIVNQIKLLRSLIGKDAPFDTAAVRDTADKLSNMAIEAGLDGQIDEEWLALVYDIAKTMVDRINTAEQRIIETATQTRNELALMFSSQLENISDK
jgi:transcriptional regulator with XRE-family HTH domain